MLRNTTFLILLFCASVLNAQITETFQPDSTLGKDAMIWSMADSNTSFGYTDGKNYGKHRDFIAHEWTWSGTTGRRQSLMQFDINHIAPAQIIDARLSLYYNPNSGDPFHSQLSGSNECSLKRIIDPWGEHSVTWNNRPGTSNVNVTTLPASMNDTQDYINIDVTALVQDMIDDTNSSFGFMINMVTPFNYRRLVFASSDEPTKGLHPKLEITYSSTVGITDFSSAKDLSVYPNPANEEVLIGWNAHTYAIIELLDMQGRVVHSSQVRGTQYRMRLNAIPAGLYSVRVRTHAGVFVRRFLRV